MNGKYILAFGLGAAVGAEASGYFFKTKYEQLAQEEIDSVKEVFSKKNRSNEEQEEVEAEESDEEDPKKKASIAREKPDIMEYASKLVDCEYTNYSNIEMPLNDVKSNDDVVERPYVITPKEFSDNYDYETITLTYYSDKVLTDDLDEPIEDIENVVGVESLTHFGEYEDDSVYVRNDRLRVDYEILLDERKYTDVLKKKPYKGGFYDDEGTH